MANFSSILAGWVEMADRWMWGIRRMLVSKCRQEEGKTVLLKARVAFSDERREFIRQVVKSGTKSVMQ